MEFLGYNATYLFIVLSCIVVWCFLAYNGNLSKLRDLRRENSDLIHNLVYYKDRATYFNSHLKESSANLERALEHNTRLVSEKHELMLELSTLRTILDSEDCLEELVTKVVLWADDRKLITNSNPVAQFNKLLEEVGELEENLNKGKSPIDDIGDCMVVLTIIAAQTGLTLRECLAYAYDEIKDRKGYMNSEGIFIKET